MIPDEVRTIQSRYQMISIQGYQRDDPGSSEIMQAKMAISKVRMNIKKFSSTNLSSRYITRNQTLQQETKHSITRKWTIISEKATYVKCNKYFGRSLPTTAALKVVTQTHRLMNQQVDSTKYLQ